jgi:hypothetical protein
MQNLRKGDLVSFPNGTVFIVKSVATNSARILVTLGRYKKWHRVKQAISRYFMKLLKITKVIPGGRYCKYDAFQKLSDHRKLTRVYRNKLNHCSLRQLWWRSPHI